MRMRAKYLMLLLAFAMVTFGGNALARGQRIDTPANSSFKSYMDYRAITNTRSKQYAIQRACETDENGLRTYNGHYTVAVGSGFGATVGDYIDVKLETGVVLHCIVGDMKQDRHTGDDNIQVTHNGNIVEFIVNANQLNSAARSSGSIEDIAGFEGDVASVTVLGSASIGDEEIAEEDAIYYTPFTPNYLVLAKSSVSLDNGETLFAIDYLLDGTCNSIVCTEDFYDLVYVGDVLESLE